MKALPFFRAITRFGGSRVGMRPVRDVGRLAVTFMLLAGLTAALSSPAIQPAAAQQTDTQEPAPPQAAPFVLAPRPRQPGGGYFAVKPPSASRFTPVMMPASAEAR